jgi:hypothetical protein
MACAARVLALALATCCGAGCQQMMANLNQSYQPRALPPNATREQVIAVVNEQTANLHSVYTTEASISVPLLPAFRSSLALERPRRFRLKAELTGLTGPEADVGSNDDLFWLWVRRNQPPALYFCRHDQFATSSARRLLPIEPDWLIEALGVTSFAPGEDPQGPYPVRAGRLEMRSVRYMADGPVTKLTVVDDARGWVLEQHLYDQRGQRLASATASEHRRDPTTGVTLPHHVEIQWPAAQLTLKVDIRNLEINTLGANAAHLWQMPAFDGYANVDLGDPRFQLPVPPAAEPTPAPQPVAPPPQPQIVRRPVFPWLDGIFRR